MHIRTIRDDYTGVRHTASIIVFPPDDSRPGMKDILGDFAWRRTHSKPYNERDILNAVRDKIIRMGHRIKSIKYSKKAGCSMCPCSPGYIINTDQDAYHKHRKIAIWLE